MKQPSECSERTIPPFPPPTNTSGPSKLLDWTQLLFCNCIWASQFVLVKLVESEVGPVFTTAFPMLLATVLLIPFVWFERQRRPQEQRSRVRWKDIANFLIIGALGQVVAQLFVTWGTQRSLASNAAVLSLALPIATALMAYCILSERMTKLRWLSFAIAIAGVVVASGADLRQMNFSGRGYMFGNALIFLGVMGSAFYNVYSKVLLIRFSPLEVLLGSYFATCIVLLPLALAVEPEGFLRLSSLSVRGWLGLTLLAVFQYCLSMVVFLKVLTRLDATQAALSNYMIPVFGVVIAWLVLSDHLQPPTLIGGILVLVSTLLVTVWEERARATMRDGAEETQNEP